MTRTLLVHLNVALPEDAPPASDRNYANALMTELEGAVAVGTDPDHAPLLAACGEVVAVDGEEI